jgi:prepilin-type N-terminal cleavage/methylation domain-containing protein
MKFVSTGTPAASRSRRDPRQGQRKGQAGFTLLEALVALALVLSFASVLGPHLSQARRIMDHAEGRVAAQVMLRSLLDAPFDRSGLAKATRKGEANGLRWRIVAEPVLTAVPGAPDQPRWLPYRVYASVAWGADQLISAETIRLGRAEP